MTSENDSISGLVSEKDFSNDDEISKETSERSLSKDRVRKRLKRGSEDNTESEADLLQSAGERDLTETEQFGTESSVKRKRNRNKRRAHEDVQGYLDMEASLDDEDETERNYSGELGLSREEHDKYLESLMNRKSKRQEFFERFQTEDVEEIGKSYEETEEFDLDDYDDTDNRPLSLLPSLKDPKLFSVRCKGGPEKETAISLMNKYLDLRGTRNEINIFSASALDKFPGHIFIEAHRDFHVKEAIKGLKNLNINTVKIIPVKEVTQVFQPDPTKQASLEVGQFVRLKKGLYKDDLAMVVEFDDSFRRIKIKMVPRLMSGSYVEEAGDNDKDNDGADKKIRPPKRFFIAEEFPEAKPISSARHDHVQVYAFDGKRFENGLLVKTLWLKNLETENIVPTLEEIEAFRRSEMTKEGREEIMERAKRTIEDSRKFANNLEKGDKVQIIQGDLKGLTAVVTEVTEDHVKVLPDAGIMTEPVQYMPNELVKVFIPGDHVQILDGKYSGITGTIMKIDNTVAHIISEDNSEEMKVLLSAIKYTTDVVVTQGQKKKGPSEIVKHDLVILNDNRTVGVVLSVQRDTLMILDTEGYVKNVKKIQILNKLNPRGHVKNSFGQDISSGCTVRVSEGAHKGHSAVVKHVYQNKLFLLDRSFTENSGIFVEHMNNCHFLGANNYDNTRMLARFNNPILHQAQQDIMMNTQNPLEEKPTLPKRQDPKSRRVSLIGQVKTITKGVYKGYRGMIQSLTENKARIELQAKNKSILIPLDHLNIDVAERESYMANRLTGKTPMYRGANSPFYINTPAYNPE